MRTIVEKTYCDKCGKALPDKPNHDWFLDVPIVFGRQYGHADYCPQCMSFFKEQFGQLRPARSVTVIARESTNYFDEVVVVEPKPESGSGKYVCDQGPCDRVFDTAQGLALHKNRIHGIKPIKLVTNG